MTPERKSFDVIAESHSGALKHISALNCNLMALQYPLLFPYGDKSYHLGINYICRRSPQLASSVSMDASQLGDNSSDDDDCFTDVVPQRGDGGRVSMSEY